MNMFLKVFIGFCLSLFLVISFRIDSVLAQPLFITTDVDVEGHFSSMDSKNIDDLLGPDMNFPFDPANHRDGSNPIKRIGIISDDNL